MTPWATHTRPPRPWQATALPIVVDACKGGRHGVVSAVMGSGKSVLIAEASRQLLDGLPDDFSLVVTTPTIRLVEQLAETLAPHCDTGRYFTHAHEPEHRVVVCCTPSAPALAVALSAAGRHCAVWIADEAHRTEADKILAAAESLAPFSRVGFSATPFLSNPSARLRCFDELLFNYSAQDAIRDGVVVPPVLVHYEGEGATADHAVLEMVRGVEGPGIINAIDIADAERYASRLRSADFAAAAIHSKLSRSDQAERIEALRSGALRALVHVRLLSEGVDLPWLRWIALRTPIGSRVTFCQMVGRALRAFPGKTNALVLDPHDQFNGFSLSYEAMLGGGVTSEAREETLDEQARRTVAEQLEQPSLPVFYDRLSSYLRRAALALYASGLAERRVASKAWRRDIASDKQLAAVAKLAWAADYASEPHRTLLGEAINIAKEGDVFSPLLKGDISDLLEILFCLARLRSWPRLDTLKEDQ